VRADIKFCGLTRAVDAECAVSLGASCVGVIFAGGPRMLTVDQAREVLAGVPDTVRRVGVFADQTADEIARIAEALNLAVAQLHGRTDLARIADLRRSFSGHIWPVLRVIDGDLTEAFSDLIEVADGVLLDAFSPKALGGTGLRLPWAAMSAELAQRRGGTPVVLAGGLTPDNVAQAIADLEPNVVDVSSGVELAPGIKDHDRMRAFREAVTRASLATSHSTARSTSR